MAREISCPVCDAEMDTRPLGDGEVNSCPAGHGVFLRRADLGSLVEAESDWHRHAGQHTQPMPAPPASKPPARAWIETLF